MSQAIQNRQAAGPTAAIEFQMLPVQLSPVRASNSCRTDSAAITVMIMMKKKKEKEEKTMMMNMMMKKKMLSSS